MEDGKRKKEDDLTPTLSRRERVGVKNDYGMQCP